MNFSSYRAAGDGRSHTEGLKYQQNFSDISQYMLFSHVNGTTYLGKRGLKLEFGRCKVKCNFLNLPDVTMVTESICNFVRKIEPSCSVAHSLQHCYFFGS